MAEEKDKKVKETKKEKKFKFDKKYILPIAGIVLVLILGIVIGLVLGKNSGKKESDTENVSVDAGNTQDKGVTGTSDTDDKQSLPESGDNGNTDTGNTTDTTVENTNDDNNDSDKTDDSDAGKNDDNDSEDKNSDKTDDSDSEKNDDKNDSEDKNSDKTDDSDAGKNDDKNDSEDKNSDKTDDSDSGKNDDKDDKNDGDDKNSDKTDDSDSGKNDDSGSGDKDEYVLTYTVDNSWQDGNTNMFGVQMGITNNTGETVSGWKLVLKVEGLSTITGWNGTFTQNKETLTIKDAGYNSDIYSGGTVVIGCNLGTTASSVKIVEATINGKPMTIVKGKVDQNDPGIKNDDNGGSGNDNGGSKENGNKDAEDTIDDVKKDSKAKKGDDWLYTDGRNILDKDGKKVWITGVNWFGYNTGTNTFDGLWNSELVPTVKAIADHGFNLIRVPISAQLINQWAAGEYPKANYNNAYNSELNNMNSLEIFEYFLALAEKNGLKVMPDIHSAETNASGHNVNLWYTDKITVEDYYHALEWMAERYADNDTIIAYDLKNEPHGKPYEGSGAAIWNNSKSANNWKYVAETAAAKILKKNPNVLIMVEGIEIYPIDTKNNSDFYSTNDKDYYFNWWGGNLRGVADYPVNLGKYQNKLVYSPHDYGPTVYEQPWFEGDYTYESLMDDCWHDNWFYIYEENIAPLLIGEWGGFMREPNLTWMTYMRKLIKKYHLNHTFWCLNANSGDTGGLLLDDFKTWDTEKYNFVKEVLWQENGKFVGLDHEVPLGVNGITLKDAKGIS